MVSRISVTSAPSRRPAQNVTINLARRARAGIQILHLNRLHCDDLAASAVAVRTFLAPARVIVAMEKTAFAAAGLAENYANVRVIAHANRNSAE